MVIIVKISIRDNIPLRYCFDNHYGWHLFQEYTKSYFNAFECRNIIINGDLTLYGTD